MRSLLRSSGAYLRGNGHLTEKGVKQINEIAKAERYFHVLRNGSIAPAGYG